MTIQDTLLNVQAVRRVLENDTSTNETVPASSRIFHLPYHPDTSSGKDILLWDDILAAFKEDVIHVRSGTIILPFLKGRDFKNLDPLRIAAVPGATLDVVVRGPSSPSNELSLEPLQRALPETPPKGNNSSSTLVSNTATRAATTVKRNPVGGLVEEAMQNYNHIDNPATLPPRRGPQAILDERAASKENGTDIHNPPTTTISSDSNNSDSRLGAPQEPTPTSTPDFAETMMKARFGDKDAQYAVAESYYFGQGIPQDYQTAAGWYLKAAEQGHADAQNDIGYSYQHGQGVPQDYSRAMEWFQKAAEQGNARAQYNIGYLHQNGLGVPKDYSRAMEWHQKAAEQGHVTAQSNIGYLYQNGLGVPKDYSRAMEWHQKAAEQGSAPAQSNIGCHYFNGLGVPKDYSRAMEWFQKAAEQGNAGAQFNIGAMYEYDRGVQKDKSKAMEWYKKAADGGDADAKEAFDKLERQGYRVDSGGKKRGLLDKIFN